MGFTDVRLLRRRERQLLQQFLHRPAHAAHVTGIAGSVGSATTGGDVKRAAIEYGDGPAVDADDVGTG